MQNRGQIVLGAILLGLGVIFLIGAIFDIDFGALCFPVALIAIGVLLVMRPKLSGGSTAVDFLPIGDLKRTGNWDVQDREYWVGVAEIDLDLAHANLPPGETRFRMFGFVGNLEVWLPADVEVSLSANGVVIDAEVFGRDYDHVFSGFDYTSDGYVAAERKVRIDTTCFVTDLKIRRI